MLFCWFWIRNTLLFQLYFSGCCFFLDRKANCHFQCWVNQEWEQALGPEWAQALIMLVGRGLGHYQRRLKRFPLRSWISYYVWTKMKLLQIQELVIWNASFKLQIIHYTPFPVSNMTFTFYHGITECINRWIVFSWSISTDMTFKFINSTWN